MPADSRMLIVMAAGVACLLLFLLMLWPRLFLFIFYQLPEQILYWFVCRLSARSIAAALRDGVTNFHCYTHYRGYLVAVKWEDEEPLPWTTLDDLVVLLQKEAEEEISIFVYGEEDKLIDRVTIPKKS